MWTQSHRGIHADPRTLALFVIVCNLVVMGSSSLPLIALTLIIIGVFLAVTTPLAFSVGWALFIAGWVGCFYVLPQFWHSPVSVFLTFIAYWMFRFAGIVGATVAAAYAIRIDEIGAVLTRMHAPRALFVPIMVIVRFFPIAIAEIQAIRQALALRKLNTIGPLRTVEYVIIPLLAAGARLADELSAASIIKGLGSGPRTTISHLRFSSADLCILIALGVVMAFRGYEIAHGWGLIA